MGDEGKLEPARGATRIRFFDACQWELFYKDSGFTDAHRLSCSPNADAYFLSIINKYPNAGIVQAVENGRDGSGFI
ncbi:hypothetical protein [Arthrobacter sunyaminii]|uniref:Uncharacterized protein n=1 Tax=Arthrobacter sunyaminii TaxID=2816859 RepID=A0A975XMH0_9MICC|nr:hypothetical protein [Arthrobacter sunyaminii]MBO0906958.1 hypothetical protein [Arthrobacter sunyaminii]QWQ37703.1 hypothetical protein KG104_08370 [Arthrobacter sunyaminii]